MFALNLSTVTTWKSSVQAQMTSQYIFLLLFTLL